MKRTVPRLSGPARAYARSELIGLDARVAASTDPQSVGVAGTLVDETLRTVTLRVGGAGGRRLRLSKAAVTLEFRRPGQDPVRVEGRAIEFRPEDRTKKVR